MNCVFCFLLKFRLKVESFEDGLGLFLEFHWLEELLLDSFFALDEMEVPFVASGEDIVSEDDFVVIFLKFMKIIHVELEIKSSFTCLINEGKLLWRKYWGRTSCSIWIMSNIIIFLPSWVQLIIVGYFCLKYEVLGSCQWVYRWTRYPFVFCCLVRPWINHKKFICLKYWYD